MAAPNPRGIALPFRITPGASDVVPATGDALRAERGKLILGTRATAGGAVGELAWDPERGSRLELLRLAAASSALGDLAVVYVGEAFRQLPDERVRGVDVVIDDTTLTIAVETVPAADTSTAGRVAQATTTITR